MPTPRLNWILLLLFSVVTVVVFVLSLLLPGFRGIAFAPVRELLLPPPEPIILSILYSTEKQAWLEEVLIDFEANPPTVDDRPITVKLEKMGSREMYLAVLDGTHTPDVISPASSLQISILEDLSRNKYGEALVDAANQTTCRSMLETPLVVVAWRDRAEVLWGDDPDGNMWLSLKNSLTDPEGWAAYGRPEWGYIKFGHTDPTKSNSGFMTIVLMTYNFFGKTVGLSAQEILSDSEFQKWLEEFEASVSDFGSSTGTYMRDIVAYGPSKYDLVAVYEATAIEHIENARGRYGDLQILYPPATIISDHPFCVLNGEWMNPQKQEATKLLLDYLSDSPAQEIAVDKYGFRPVNPFVSIESPESPFIRYFDNGLRIDLPPEIALPPGNVLDTLLTFWIRNIQR
jgi:ABC-type Fe3+ transport system substrate-binding protein